ncbi:MAG: EscU/YscU/HrcU family type III secretion system export apparatus switch protein [Planctomycetota bacterium]|nr:EscU/YscU/HrcU family type III secretion system export apparatus switch protein [Planctomycetota bacterium]
MSAQERKGPGESREGRERRGKDEPKPSLAVALRYEPNRRPAPDLIAKGRGELAERILEVAHEHDVPVREDPDLLQLLALCDVGEEIPIELYAAVAELLAYLYRVNKELSGEPTT